MARVGAVLERSPEGVRPLTMIARFTGLGGGMEGSPKFGGCARAVCAEGTAGQGAGFVRIR